MLGHTTATGTPHLTKEPAMSISITVSGPNTVLGMLRALALKALTHAQHAWDTLTRTVTLSTATLKSAANVALTALASQNGYELALRGTRWLTTTTWNLIRYTCSRTTRLVGHATRAGYHALALINPTLATSVENLLEQYVVEPILNTALTVDATVTSIGDTIWALAHTSLVRTTTTTAAQAASSLLALHAISNGYLAATLVHLIPTLMTGIIWATNPLICLSLIAGTFTLTISIALWQLTRTTTETPTQPDEPLTQIDLERIIANLRVDITPDGSVTVHGIPADLPDHITQHVAKTATNAATQRLKTILRHRPIPNRDDRRLLTKIAREAIRKAA